MWGKKFCVLTALAALVVLSGCGPKTVKVAVAVSQTGDYAKGGKEVLQGAQLAVDDWNARGGVLGKKIELVQFDDEGKADKATKVAEEICDLGAKAVVGHYNSDATLAASEIYHKNRLLMITPSSTTPQVTDRAYLTVFRVCGRDDQQGAMAAEYAVKTFPGAKVVVIHDRTSYGQDLANEFLKNYEFLTKTKASYYGDIDRAQPDYASVVAKVKETGAGILYFGGAYPQGGPLLKALREAGEKAAFFTGDGGFDPSLVTEAGVESAEGAFVSFVPDLQKIPDAQSILDRYRKRFGEPGTYSLYAYEAMNAVLSAFSEAKSTDSLEAARALHKMTVKTVFGPLKFDDKGDPTATPYVMWVVRGGQFVEAPNPEPQPSGP